MLSLYLCVHLVYMEIGVWCWRYVWLVQKVGTATISIATALSVVSSTQQIEASMKSAHNNYNTQKLWILCLIVVL